MGAALPGRCGVTSPDPFCPSCQEAEGYCTCPADIPGDGPSPNGQARAPRKRARKVPNEPPPAAPRGPLYTPADIRGEDLATTHAAYLRWFGKEYDLGALDVVLAAAAAERLGGDPPWLMVVGGSGAAKTETVAPLTGAGAHVISTINGEAALLSGTSKRDRAKDATGGLLRQIGPRGLLVVKDFTSVLSMNRDTRALVLAALREIYDGRWSRNVGTDGGQTLTWHGRLVVIGAVTTAWDSAYQVVSTMGDRFVLVRMSSGQHRLAAGKQAMANVDHETVMREELAGHVGRLLAGVAPDSGAEVAEDDLDELLGLADLVTRCRTAVERDYQRNPMFAHGLEMPTRFAKQLVQIVRGGIALGMPAEAAMATAARAARDSMPPLRLAVLADIAGHPMSRTAEVTRRLQVPWSTADRTLQELHLLECLVTEDEPYGTAGKVRWLYSLATGTDPDVLGKFTTNVSTPERTP